MAGDVPVLPPLEAVRYFAAKGFTFGFSWQDVWQEEHARAFTVAKAMTRDVLETIREAVDTALREGRTLEQFREALQPELEARGWWGKRRMIDPLTGQSEAVQLGSPRRLRTIFEVNMRTAYQAGRWERIERQKRAFPYLRYTSVMDGRERPEHHAWHGTVLPVDHAWWDTHYPPCGWNCRCTATAFNARMLERRGYAITERPATFATREWRNKRTGEVHQVERGIDPGWSYHVGKAGLAGLAPTPLPDSFGGSDAGSAAAAAALRGFFEPFGIGAGDAEAGRHFVDAGGWPLAISLAWFMRERRLVLPPPDRRAFLAAAAEAIASPDEIRWVWINGLDGRAMLFRRYLLFDAGGAVRTAVDIGREGWRFRDARDGRPMPELQRGVVVWSAEKAAQASGGRLPPRHPRGTREGGRFRSGSSITGLSAPLNGSELEAIEGYTGDGFAAINEQLRDGPEAVGHDDWQAAFIDDQVALLDSAIAKGRIDQDVVLHRALTGRGVDWIEQQDLRVGSEFSDAAFVSTTKRSGFARTWGATDPRRLTLEIQARRGTVALDITEYSAAGTGEYEVLLPRNARLRVTGFDQASRTIKVETVIDEAAG